MLLLLIRNLGSWESEDRVPGRDSWALEDVFWKDFWFLDVFSAPSSMDFR